MKRKWDISDEQTIRKCTEEILARLEEQGNVAFGKITADDIIAIVLQNLAPDIYNQALIDANKVIHTKLGDIETDLELLQSV